MDQQPKRPFNWRGFVSVTSGLAFLGMSVTGIVLFIIPPGYIANWGGWQFLTLSKYQWIGLHIWFSLLFLIVALLHIYYNWKCLIGYFKDTARHHLALRWEWGAACLLIWVMSVGTVRGVVPFSSLLDWHTAVKHRFDNQPSPSSNDTGFSRGQGQGFGQMSLSVYCEQTNLDVTKACTLLEQAGMTVTTDMTLRQIADIGQVHPSEIRRILETP